MKRHILQSLIKWKNNPGRMPLLIRGARQTGKSFIVKEFGKSHFDQLVVINFEQEPRFKYCFNTLKSHEIIQQIELLTNQTIIPEHTLLFLDEIQECPDAIKALRYFFEEMPNLHIIGAGSLLEFAFDANDFSMPVGRVEFQYLYPMTFSEMLIALAEDKLVDFIKNISLKDKIPLAIHQKLMDLVRLYFILGGMPQTLSSYTTQSNLLECRKIQTALLNTYRADFGKYSTRIQQEYCERVFEKAPGLICKHFKYTDINPDLDSRLLKLALRLLFKANVLTPIYYSSATGLPLSATSIEKYYKLLFLDIGLVQAAQQIAPDVLLNQNLILINRGDLTEQFVGQHLLCLPPSDIRSNLFYWQRDERGSQAEVDYIITVNEKIIPLEVKSGKLGRLKSLHMLMQSHHLPLGIKLSHENFDVSQSIWTVPLYLIEELPRLITLTD